MVSKLVNLTPHPIVFRPDDVTEYTISPDGRVARVSMEIYPITTLVTGPSEVRVPLVITIHGEVEGLPKPEPGTFFIVSRMVFDAMRGKNRDDLIVPDTGSESAVRDSKGQIVAVRRFTI